MTLIENILSVNGVAFLMFCIFAIAALGYGLGRITVKGVNLGTAGVFIVALLFGCFFVGFICGIIGVVLANKGLIVYRANPTMYTGSGMLSAGKIMSIIGIIFGAIYIVYYTVAVAIFGAAGFAYLDLIEGLM